MIDEFIYTTKKDLEEEIYSGSSYTDAKKSMHDAGEGKFDSYRLIKSDGKVLVEHKELLLTENDQLLPKNPPQVMFIDSKLCTLISNLMSK